jgi:hypothetical protein
LFVNLGHEDQIVISEYLSYQEDSKNYNFYMYSDEPNVNWLLYALNRTTYKFIDFNSSGFTVNALGGYMVARSNVFYKTNNENLAAIYNHINQNRITNIKQFLERVFNDQKQ